MNIEIEFANRSEITTGRITFMRLLPGVGPLFMLFDLARVLSYIIAPWPIALLIRKVDRFNVFKNKAQP